MALLYSFAPSPLVIDATVIWTAEALAADREKVMQTLAGSRRAIEHSKKTLAQHRPLGSPVSPAEK